MKKIKIKTTLLGVGLLVASMHLSGCAAPDSHGVTTGVGVTTGAVIGGLAGSTIGGGVGKLIAVGAGSVLGALLGGSIGESVSHHDQYVTYSVMKKNPTNQATTWESTTHHQVYTVIPTSEVMFVDGYSHCRHYIANVLIKGKNKTVRGTACQAADGRWYALHKTNQ